MHKILPTRWGLSIFEGLIVLALLVAISWTIQHVAPGSGLAEGIHVFWHIFTVITQVCANILSAIAAFLNQL